MSTDSYPMPSSQAQLVSAFWIDQRFPGTYLSKLYAVIADDEAAAVEAVRALRRPYARIIATGELLSIEKTRQMGLKPGQVLAF